MTAAWDSAMAGVLRLPSGRLVRGRGLRHAVLDGLPGRQAIAYVRDHYASRAVETPGQRRFVTRFH